MKHTPILIVGAGLSGLMMAAQLLRFGVQPMIIDRSLGPEGEQGYAFLEPRNLELLEQLGLLEELLKFGVPYSHLDFEHGGHVLDLKKELGEDTRFPFLLNLPTVRIKQALMAYLTNGACKIHWDTELQKLSEGDHGIQLLLKRDGDVTPVMEEWRADWVVGADGPDSLTRKDLGINVERQTYAEQLLRAELLLEKDAATTELLQEQNDTGPVRLFRQNGQWVSLFPLRGTDRYLLMCSIPAGQQGRTSARSLQSFLQMIIGPLPPGQTLTPIPKTIQIEDSGTFRAHKIAGRRSFLVGEAAGGYQHLTGLANVRGWQDAWNLGWKLAAVVQGRMGKKVLLSYQEEHGSLQIADSLPVLGQALNIRQQLPKTLRFLEPFWVSRFIRHKPGIGKHKTLSGRLSGLYQHYRHARLSVHYSPSALIKAGDRFPYLAIYNERELRWTNTHEAIRKNTLVLVVLGTMSQPALHTLSQWIKQKYPQGLGIFYLPYSERNKAVFEAFEMKETHCQGVLVRPDMHIAYLSNALNIAVFDNYLAEILDWNLYRQFE